AAGREGMRSLPRLQRRSSARGGYARAPNGRGALASAPPRSRSALHARSIPARHARRVARAPEGDGAGQAAAGDGPARRRGDVRDGAAYSLTAPLAEPPHAKAPDRLPILTRAVAYDEVSKRVFRRTCWHCHSEPDYAIGDGGPGNSGGFGFAPRGLNLAAYE